MPRKNVAAHDLEARDWAVLRFFVSRLEDHGFAQALRAEAGAYDMSGVTSGLDAAAQIEDDITALTTKPWRQHITNNAEALARLVQLVGTLPPSALPTHLSVPSDEVLDRLLTFAKQRSVPTQRSAA